MHAVTVTECRKTGHHVIGIGLIRQFTLRKFFAVDDLNGIGDLNPLTHMSDCLIRHQKYGASELFGKVECLYREFIHLLNGRRGERNYRVVAV